MILSQNYRRKHWLDIAKGIAIILMVIGHTSIPRFMSDFIFSFHMPLFFIASGFASNYSEHTPCKYIKHKVYTLMLPFIIYSVIVSSVLFFIGEINVCKLLLNGWGGYALWFVPVLFLSSIFAMLTTHISNKLIRYCIMLSFFLAGVCLCYFKVRLPWTLSTIPYATFLILVGVELRRLQTWIETTNHYLEIVFLIVIVGLISQFCRLDLAYNNIIPIVPLSIGAIAGTLMIFRLSVWIEQHLSHCAVILQRIGRNTYIVVAFSQVIIMCINYCFVLPIPLKYILLIISLILLKYVKDGINRLVKFDIL